MHSHAFLRLLTSFLLAFALVSCGDESKGSGEKSTKKEKDAGSAKSRDAGAKSTSEDEEDEENEDEENEDEENEDEENENEDESSDNESSDDEERDCEVDDDCVLSEDEESGIACCDKQTGACFVSDEDMCPAPAPAGGGSRPTYN